MDGGGRIALGGLTRRQLLRLMAAGAGVSLLRVPYARVTRVNATVGPVPAGFLTPDEFAIVDAATALIIPTDALLVGARECGVADYIQSFLSFMPGSDANCDRHVTAADITATLLGLNSPPPNCPDGGDVNGDGAVDASDVNASESAVFGARPVFAGGPFSGRQPQPHFSTGDTPCQTCHGIADPGAAAGVAAAETTVDNYPPDAFRDFLALPRLRRMSWKIRILGADTVPEAAKNPLATQSLEVNLRQKYRDGLAALDMISQQNFAKPFVQLTAQQQQKVFDKSDQDFVTLLTYHTVEGILCAPEYGGNLDRLGWQLVGFDGDSQPLGYTIYDPTVPGNYRERPDKPNSKPNPDEDCGGFSSKVDDFLVTISSAALVAPGGPFPAPYCFDVPT
jgi:Gluconate 2-dehydrogenase subunit 3